MEGNKLFLVVNQVTAGLGFIGRTILEGTTSKCTPILPGVCHISLVKDHAIIRESR